MPLTLVFAAAVVFPGADFPFTYPVINNAAAVLFMATGEEKQEALLQVLQGKPDRENYPAQGIHPTNGSLLWLVDQAAAGPMK